MEQEKMWNRFRTFSHAILEFEEVLLQTAVEFCKNIYRRKRALMVVGYFVIVLPLCFILQSRHGLTHIKPSDLPLLKIIEWKLNENNEIYGSEI